jgi:AcrR family transcriptional regulator
MSGVAASPNARMPAAERRQAIVEAALRVFGSTSYARATTAEIARQAGVSEPIIYRHFPSKRELWLACIDAAWAELRVAIEAKVGKLAREQGRLHGVDVDARSPWANPLLPNLWIQGVTEAGDDPEIQEHVRRHMREVHDFVAGMMREHQAAGAMPADRDAGAEAWIFVAGGLLRSFADRLGGVLTGPEFAAIGRERRRWLAGEPSPRA